MSNSDQLSEDLNKLKDPLLIHVPLKNWPIAVFNSYASRVRGHYFSAATVNKPSLHKEWY